jgi:hypothetical protein
MLSICRAGEIDLFENLDIVHIRLLVVGRWSHFWRCWRRKAPETRQEKHER